jgi:transposase
VLTLSPAVRIYVATGATDLRRSIDGLAALVRKRFDLDPLSGHLFVFRNRRGDRLKILAWDHGGFYVLYKRLERGTLPGRPTTRATVSRCAAGISCCCSQGSIWRTRAAAVGMSAPHDHEEW